MVFLNTVFWHEALVAPERLFRASPVLWPVDMPILPVSFRTNHAKHVDVRSVSLSVQPVWMLLFFVPPRGLALIGSSIDHRLGVQEIRQDEKFVIRFRVVMLPGFFEPSDDERL